MALTDKLTAIADAIRAKTGKTDALTLAQMPGEIEEIQTGSNIPDGTDVTFGYVAEDNKILRVYYNDVLLPKIPEDVLAQYPYAWIRKMPLYGINTYDVLFSMKPWYYTGSGLTQQVGTQVCQWYTIPIESADTATEWTFKGSYSDETVAVGASYPVIWSNHDIPKGSATATDIYFFGSEPIPEDVYIAPVEREEAYAIASTDLNALGMIAQKLAVTTELMTVAEMIDVFTQSLSEAGDIT